MVPAAIRDDVGGLECFDYVRAGYSAGLVVRLHDLRSEVALSLADVDLAHRTLARVDELRDVGYLAAEVFFRAIGGRAIAQVDTCTLDPLKDPVQGDVGDRATLG